MNNISHWVGTDKAESPYAAEGADHEISTIAHQAHYKGDIGQKPALGPGDQETTPFYNFGRHTGVLPSPLLLAPQLRKRVFRQTDCWRGDPARPAIQNRPPEHKQDRGLKSIEAK
jgi:hypothetical protein